MANGLMVGEVRCTGRAAIGFWGGFALLGVVLAGLVVTQRHQQR
jgi:hypothetical protein